MNGERYAMPHPSKPPKDDIRHDKAVADYEIAAAAGDIRAMDDAQARMSVYVVMRREITRNATACAENHRY